MKDLDVTAMILALGIAFLVLMVFVGSLVVDSIATRSDKRECRRSGRVVVIDRSESSLSKPSTEEWRCAPPPMAPERAP